jgi:hypothetical protein
MSIDTGTATVQVYDIDGVIADVSDIPQIRGPGSKPIFGSLPPEPDGLDIDQRFDWYAALHQLAADWGEYRWFDIIEREVGLRVSPMHHNKDDLEERSREVYDHFDALLRAYYFPGGQQAA